MLKSYKEAVAELAGPWGPNETREAWLATAARRAGIPPRTAKGLFYGEISDPPTSITRKIEAALGYALNTMQDTAHAEIAQLEARLARLEKSIGAVGAVEADSGPAVRGRRHSDRMPRIAAD